MPDGVNVRPVCVDHMTFPVGDLERSLAFYRAALVDGMGWSEIDEEGSPAFGPPGSEDLILVEGGPLTPPIHLAFAAASFEQVEGFHREGLAAGGSDNGAPRHQAQVLARLSRRVPARPRRPQRRGRLARTAGCPLARRLILGGSGGGTRPRCGPGRLMATLAGCGRHETPRT